LICTTAEDSFNVFRPNLEPEEDEEQDAEMKCDPSSSDATKPEESEESKC